MTGATLFHFPRLHLNMIFQEVSIEGWKSWHFSWRGDVAKCALRARMVTISLEIWLCIFLGMCEYRIWVKEPQTFCGYAGPQHCNPLVTKCALNVFPFKSQNAFVQHSIQDYGIWIIGRSKMPFQMRTFYNSTNQTRNSRNFMDSSINLF